MLELITAVIWWPMLIAAAIFLAFVGYVLIETLLDKVWGKQTKGQKWSRK